MKNTIQNVNKTLSILAIAIVVGLAATVVSAQASNWLPPSAPPTGGNPPAPINVGASPQSKQGALSLGTTNLPTTGTMLDVIGVLTTNALGVFGDAHITGTIQIDGGSPGEGKVLTSDASGLASWQDLGSGPSGSCGTSPFQTMMAGGVYQNTTGGQLIVVADAIGGGGIRGLIHITSDMVIGKVVAQNFSSVTFVVPPGYYYAVQLVGGGTLRYSEAWKVCGGSGGGGSGVTKIIAGNNVTISPPEGTGDVTVNAQVGNFVMCNVPYPLGMGGLVLNTYNFTSADCGGTLPNQQYMCSLSSYHDDGYNTTAYIISLKVEQPTSSAGPALRFTLSHSSYNLLASVLCIKP